MITINSGQGHNPYLSPNISITANEIVVHSDQWVKKKPKTESQQN